MQTILIVDDSDVERRLAAALLMRNEQLRTLFAENGADALSTLQRAEADGELPDLVLTDLVMPEMDGLELVKAMRERYPHVAVVLMTAYGNESIASDALRFGAASYVPKAQQSERLLKTVEQVLARSQVERGRQRLMDCAQSMECSFLLDSDPAIVRPLVDFVQQFLCGVPLTDIPGRIRVAIALEEAVLNAIYHGVLRINETDVLDYRAGRPSGDLAELIKSRRANPLTRDRKVFVGINISAREAKFVVRDSGSGFDSVVISSTNGSDRFERGRNRGLTLIRSLVDEVRYNETGNEITLLKRRDQRTAAARPY